MPNHQVVSVCVVPHLLKKKKEVQLFAETKELNFSGVLFKSLFLAEKNI